MQFAIQNADNGGLKIQHIESYVMAYRASWTQILLDENIVMQHI